ncbi:MAG: hypothetical protein ACKVT2_15920 [Saprospiraceae bacterium]
MARAIALVVSHFTECFAVVAAPEEFLYRNEKAYCSTGPGPVRKYIR